MSPRPQQSDCRGGVAEGGIAEDTTTALPPSEVTRATARVAKPDEHGVAGFRLLGKLGSGGMGTVWRARQEIVGREVALKLLDPHLARDPSFVERFMREARAAGRVNHPNVVGCYDAGRDGATLWLALELVAGGDAAASARRRGGRIPETEAVRIGIDCARGLEAIEAAGLIHRDLKPANIFLAADGSAKLGDLGLARPRAGDERMTLTGAPLGTPAYMSPEQARGERGLDIRADIYSLGATLFELVVGQPPFRGETIYAVVSQVLNAPAPEARRMNPEVSPGLSAVIARAMARRPQDRYAHPAELRAELERLREGVHPLAYSESLGANLSSGLLVKPAIPVPDRPAARRRGGFGFVAFAAVAVLLGVGLWVATGQNPPAHNEPEFPPSPAPASPAALPPLSSFAAEPAPAAVQPAPALPPAKTEASASTAAPVELPAAKAEPQPAPELTPPPAAPAPAAKAEPRTETGGLPQLPPPPAALESLPAPGTVAAP